MKCITESRRSQTGFTIVELMISLVLGLIVVGGSLALFMTQRVTSKMAGQMVDVQAEGRVALDALARDLRSAGDFGCWPVSNPIDARLNQMVFDVYQGGIRGFDSGSALGSNTAASSATSASASSAASSSASSSSASSLYGVASVRAASPEDSSVLALTGVFGTVTTTAADMGSETGAVVVKTPVQPLKANDVLLITDCVNWVKFQVTAATPGDTAGTLSLTHEAGVTNAWGRGNQNGALGASFKKDSTVGRLDTIWWFIGTVNEKRGLYRLSPRDGVAVLVSDKVQALELRYDVDSNSDGVADQLDRSAADVSDWTQVRSASIRMLMRSDSMVSGSNGTTVTSFAGQSVPADKHLYMPLQMTVALRNQ